MNSIKLTVSDYEMIYNNIGYSIGYQSEVIKIENFNNEIIEKFKKYFTQTKGILLNFTINHDITIINNLMEELNDNVSDNCDIIFGTIIDEALSQDELKVNIILTGLEQI